MDWTGCEFVERVEGKMSSSPVFIGTRVPPEIFVEGVAHGMSLKDLDEDFTTITPEQIRGILAFAHSSRDAE